MHRALVLGLSCALAVAQPARAVQQIGVTVDAKLRVSTVGVSGSKVLITSAPVFTNDRLTANATGLAQIRFIDNTKLVLGPNSSVTLDRFVFSGDSSAKTVSVSATKGAFRFISGNSGSRAYSIRTPAGSIGVRGTAFDVTVQGGTTNVVLLRGQVNICPRNGDCRLVRTRCEHIAFNSRGFIQRSGAAGSTDSQRMRNLFPLLANARAILPQFQGGAAGCRGSTTQAGVQHAALPVKPSAPPLSPPDRPPPPPDPPVPSRGNPGNAKAVGNAGPNPNGRGFGNPGRGRSDVNVVDGLGTSTAAASTSGSTGGGGTGGGKGNGGDGQGTDGHGGDSNGGSGGNGNGGGGGKGNGGGEGQGNGNGGGHGGGNGNGGGQGNSER